MIELIFCLTSMLFMAWVVVLKLREDTYKKEINRLLKELGMKVDKSTSGVDVTGQSQVWGQKPFWMK